MSKASQNHVPHDPSGGIVEIDAVTVLLPEEPPAEPADLLAWLSGGLESVGVTVASRPGAEAREVPEVSDVPDLPGGPELHLLRDGYTFGLAVGRGPYEGKDPPAGVDLGRAYLTLRCPAPGPSSEDPERAPATAAGPWAPGGRLRALSWVAAALSRGGTAVVLPQAGPTLRDSAAFLRLLGDLSDPACVPFAAWIDWRLTHDRSALRSCGMELLGLPEVQVRLGGGPGTWAWERGQEALLSLCHAMVRSGAPLAEGTVLTVPIGIKIGAYPLPAQPPGTDVERYRLGVQDGVQQLERDDSVPDATARWEEASGGGAAIGLNAYQTLFRHSLPVAVPGELVAVFSPPELAEGSPGHSVDVRLGKGREGYWLVTNGVGRVPQPGGSPEEGSARLELVAHVQSHSPALASLLSSLAEAVHGHGGGGETWRPGDTLTLPEEIAAQLGVQNLLLASGGEVSFPRGAPVTLLLLVPLSDEEMERVRVEKSASWFGEPLADPARAESIRLRWPLV
jgi:hypothetical protein